MKKFRSIVVALFLSGSILVALNLMAEQKGPGGPPPEIKACENKKAGDSCTFKTRDGKDKSDTCKSIETPKGKELSCGDMPRPPKNGDDKKPEK